jgi:protocatechuate 3,4-dioxygenase beta subunit
MLALAQAAAPVSQASVSGQVVDAVTHAPIAGAEVSLFPQLAGPPPAGVPLRPNIVATDDAGRFVMTNVEPGRYRLNVRKTGFAPADTATAPLNVTAGTAVPPVTLSLQRGGAIVGRVVDTTGQPLSDMSVMVLRQRPPLPPQVAARVAAAGGAPAFIPAGGGARTDDLGQFRLHSLAPGEYVVQAAPGFGPMMAGRAAPAQGVVMVPTYFPGTDDVASAQRISIRAGETSPDLTITMMTAAAHQISGVVIDQNGAPVADAMVRLEHDRAGGSIAALSLGPGAQTKTDGRGVFTLSGIVDGSYSVLAAAPQVVSRQTPGSGGLTGGFVAGSTSGGVGRGSFTTFENRNGVMVQYNDAASARLPVTMSGGNVTGLQLVVNRTQ